MYSTLDILRILTERILYKYPQGGCMKRILALIVLCCMGQAAVEAKKANTKFVCTVGGEYSSTSVEFATRSACESACLKGGPGAVCEETAIDTELINTASID